MFNSFSPLCDCNRKEKRTRKRKLRCYHGRTTAASAPTRHSYRTFPRFQPQTLATPPSLSSLPNELRASSTNITTNAPTPSIDDFYTVSRSGYISQYRKDGCHVHYYGPPGRIARRTSPQHNTSRKTSIGICRSSHCISSAPRAKKEGAGSSEGLWQFELELEFG